MNTLYTSAFELGRDVTSNQRSPFSTIVVDNSRVRKDCGHLGLETNIFSPTLTECNVLYDNF